MHSEIFDENQKQLLPYISKYKKNYFLVGGTAIALHIGHRHSIDFDLFTEKKINFTAVKKDITSSSFPYSVIHAASDQIHFIVNNVKLTFFEFPFFIPVDDMYEKYCRMPDLITLAAMKAFALGGRGKWKDYVDLYFIIKGFHSIEEICDRAKKLFQDVFNPILFRKHLCYFGDINYSETVEYLPGFSIEEKLIQEFLAEVALKSL